MMPAIEPSNETPSVPIMPTSALWVAVRWSRSANCVEYAENTYMVPQAKLVRKLAPTAT